MTTTLITIPISHYCEKARWALDRARVPYREASHVQLVHRLASWRAGGNGTLPVLVHEDGVLGESADIVTWAAGRMPAALAFDPADPEATELEAGFDEVLGPEARRWAYHGLRNSAGVGDRYSDGIPAWEHAVIRHGFPLVTRGIVAALNVTPDTASRAHARVLETFDRVAERLADGRRFLCGDRFGRADLAFAALAGPALMPPDYGVPLPQPDELDPAMRPAVEAFRAHPAGAFALRVLAAERRR